MKISHNAEKLKVNEGPLEINVTLVMPWANLKVISHVKRQPSNLKDDPEIGSVMGWPTTTQAFILSISHCFDILMYISQVDIY